MAKPRRLILANMVNQLMTARPSPGHARSLNAVGQRKLWRLHEGDCLITPLPVDEAFKSYVCSQLGINLETITIYSPSGDELGYLADRLAQDLTWQQWQKQSEWLVAPFALDWPTLRWAQREKMAIEGYDSYPDATLMQHIMALNSKSGFRALAQQLGMSVVPGQTCHQSAELEKTVGQWLSMTGKVMIKLDRGSNGYGHLVVSEQEKNLSQTLANYCQHYRDQPAVWTVEVFMPFIHVPSIEMVVDDQRANIFYPCNQFCHKHSFMGMVTPSHTLSEVSNALLIDYGVRFGDYVYGLGYRGYCDVDCGLLADGKLYASESNFRRTGGTYLEELARRLSGAGDYWDRCWMAHAMEVAVGWNHGKVYEAMDRAGLVFDHGKGEGILLTADTFDFDHKLRYFILAADCGRVEGLERELWAVVARG